MGARGSRGLFKASLRYIEKIQRKLKHNISPKILFKTLVRVYREAINSEILLTPWKEQGGFYF